METWSRKTLDNPWYEKSYFQSRAKTQDEGVFGLSPYLKITLRGRNSDVITRLNVLPLSRLEDIIQQPPIKLIASFNRLDLLKSDHSLALLKFLRPSRILTRLTWLDCFAADLTKLVHSATREQTLNPNRGSENQKTGGPETGPKNQKTGGAKKTTFFHSSETTKKLNQ